MNGKIKGIATITRIASRLRKTGKKVVFTNGCFDIIHKGHLDLLKKAKALGEVLIVGLNSDSSVKKIKGATRPITGEKNRAFVLSCISFVDYITIFSQPTPLEIIKAVKPDILVKGGDWKVDDIVGGDFIDKRGGKIISIPLTKGYSTSNIIERVYKKKKASKRQRNQR